MCDVNVMLGSLICVVVSCFGSGDAVVNICSVVTTWGFLEALLVFAWQVGDAFGGLISGRVRANFSCSSWWAARAFIVSWGLSAVSGLLLLCIEQKELKLTPDFNLLLDSCKWSKIFASDKF